MQKGVVLGGRTWNTGRGDHCVDSSRYGRNYPPRAPGQQIFETRRMVRVALDAVMVETSTQGWAQCVEQQLKEKGGVVSSEKGRKRSFKDGGCRGVVGGGSRSKIRKATRVHAHAVKDIPLKSCS